MKRTVRIALLAAGLLLALSVIAYADNGTDSGSAAITTGEIALLLAPLVAAATAIERVIEMGFNLFEGLWLQVSKVPKTANDYVGWARQQVAVARASFNRPPSGESLDKLEDALLDAQKRLESVLKTDPYISLKQVISLMAGIVLGLVIAFLTKLQMFALLKVPLGDGDFVRTMDMIVTGLVIGTGSAPVHSLIGILQKSKDAIDEARALTAGKANATQVELLKLLEAQDVRAARAAAVQPGTPRAGAEPPPQEPMSQARSTRTIDRLLGR